MSKTWSLPLRNVSNGVGIKHHQSGSVCILGGCRKVSSRRGMMVWNVHSLGQCYLGVSYSPGSGSTPASQAKNLAPQSFDDR